MPSGMLPVRHRHPGFDKPLALVPGGRAWDETLALVSADGVRLRGALWRHAGCGAPRGLVLLLTGRTEFLEKHTLTAGELVARGFAVASLDWRGQGLSQRLIWPHAKGHVAHFSHFHRDLAALIAHPAVAEVPGPRVMLAISMGATIGVGALYGGAVAVDGAVLVAPMLGIVMGRWLRMLSRVVLPVARRAGRTARWPPLPRVARPHVFDGFEGNQLTGDREMFDWLAATLHEHRELQLAMPTLGWLVEAMAEMTWVNRQGRLDCPCLFLLGTDEAVVTPEAVRAGAVRIGARLDEIDGGRHDLMLETPPRRAEVWRSIDRFLGAHGL